MSFSFAPVSDELNQQFSFFNSLAGFNLRGVEHLQYNESSNGSQIELPRNAEFEVLLAETRTAGYHWLTKKDGAPACHLIADTTQTDPSRKGGSGTHRWRFRAVSADTSEIELHYLRSWEQSAKPARTFKLQVRVRP